MANVVAANVAADSKTVVEPKEIPMKIAIASGKGGTGKTTVSVSLALAAAGPVQYVDCDVEEPNGHIFLQPSFTKKEEIFLTVPEVIEEKCNACGKCRDLCRFNAITVFGKKLMTFPELCHACGGCFLVCPEESLAKGKLVSLVKKQARELAEKRSASWILVDGPPGIGCPVIASMSGADFVLLVTEPTLSGLHDLNRVADLAKHFNVRTGVCINKWDLQPDYCNEIEQVCRNKDISVLARIPFDTSVVESIVHGQPLLKYAPDAPATSAIRQLWEGLQKIL